MGTRTGTQIGTRPPPPPLQPPHQLRVLQQQRRLPCLAHLGLLLGACRLLPFVGGQRPLARLQPPAFIESTFGCRRLSSGHRLLRRAVPATAVACCAGMSERRLQALLSTDPASTGATAVSATLPACCRTAASLLHRLCICAFRLASSILRSSDGSAGLLLLPAALCLPQLWRVRHRLVRLGLCNAKRQSLSTAGL